MPFIEPTLISLSNQSPQASPVCRAWVEVAATHIFVFPCVTSVAPQLWCNCLTAMVQLPHSCGATEISLEKQKKAQIKPPEGQPTTTLVRLERFVFPKNIGIRIIRKIRVHQKTHSSAAPRYFLPRTKRITRKHQSGHPSSTLVKLARCVFPQKTSASV